MFSSSTAHITFESEILVSGYGVDEDVDSAMLEGLLEGIGVLPNIQIVELEFNAYKDIMVI